MQSENLNSAMEPSAPHSKMSFPQIVPKLSSGLSSFVVHAAKFSFYLLSVAGFLVVVISGLVLVRTQYALKGSAEKESAFLTSRGRKPAIPKSTDADDALNKRDVEVTAAMKRARRFALFGPLPSVLTMIAVPVSLHLNSVGDIGVRVLLSLLLIAIIHCANACTLQTYFSLIENETRVSFGSELRSARGEKMHSACCLFIYFTVLFALSLVETTEKEGRADVTKGWELTTARSSLPSIVAELSEDFSHIESIAGGELERSA